VAHSIRNSFVSYLLSIHERPLHRTKDKFLRALCDVGFMGIALVAILVALASTVFLISFGALLLRLSFSSAGIELQVMGMGGLF